MHKKNDCNENNKNNNNNKKKKKNNNNNNNNNNNTNESIMYIEVIPFVNLLPICFIENTSISFAIKRV